MYESGYNLYNYDNDNQLNTDDASMPAVDESMTDQIGESANELAFLTMTLMETYDHEIAPLLIQMVNASSWYLGGYNDKTFVATYKVYT